MREANAVGDRAHLHRYLMTVDGALPDRLSRRPRRDKDMRMAGAAAGADKPNHDAFAFAGDVEDDLMALQPHRAAALALHQPAVHLAGNPSLAFTKHAVDGGAHRRQPPRDLAFRGPLRNPFRKFLGDETGRQIALAPARMTHQRRQERDVGEDDIYRERIER